MKKNERNEELQSRREFFKKAAKGALPILGAMVLANAPLLTNASEIEGCDWGCSGSCWSSCQSTCRGYCSSGCTGACSGGCKGTCANSCNAGSGRRW
ncbi:MAG: Cys-Xaa-Xaa-Xaa repeat radical SAM target protein [Alloprevotella sp.]|nr:Cys-Xaa-Xaa-Xaa repeat radical SAM target protein [Bacteroidales bacterium]MDY4459052.1 Cys-Xaa-Xaa-Xaa repeat radical SAM target protein [Alloprevotella sp.]